MAGQLFYIPVNVTNTGVAAREYTQRTRSFFFACLALVVARTFGRDDFTFYENGVVSLNIPNAKDVLGARATRTTHPRVIRGFEELFSAILERDITIRTPFQWRTKREVTQKVAEHGFGHLLATTSSCTHPRPRTKHQQHCGACSQCIDRRFGVLAAGLGDLDPAGGYELDLLLGDRSLDCDVRMAVAYIKFFQNFASLPRDRFIADHPQITPALRYFPDLSADEAAGVVYDLYHRHSEDVLAVIRDALEHHSAQPTCGFGVAAEAGRILFNGGFTLEGANFQLVEALLPNFRAGKRNATEIAFIRSADLAAQLSMEEASLRQQLTRLRKLVTERLAVDQGIVLGTYDFIENKERDGYRLSPALREVSLADLRG